MLDRKYWVFVKEVITVFSIGAAILVGLAVFLTILSIVSIYFNWGIVG